MSLIKYKKKRTLSETSEPIGGKSKNKSLHFVVQKHDASHLHYDFRLEMGGVLKSWAVPKGPSTDPDIKRLAMMVEDHPYDYRNFEGVIPEGNYGAGTVMVWDEGTYGASEVTGSKQTHERNLLRQLKDGKIKFVLNGRKLKGEFVLIRSSQGQKDNAWLLKKTKDEFASKEDVTLLEKSAKSKRTIEQIAGTSAIPAKKASEGKTRNPKASTPKRKVQPNLSSILESLADSNFPNTISPMLTGKVGKKNITPADKKDKKTLLNLSEETQATTINGHTVKFTNLSKIFWPKERITKRDLINYYYQVAPYILLYLKDRPQSLNRHPNGIEGNSFYQKDVTGKVPTWIKTYLYHSEGDNRDKHFMVATDEASLLYMASLGCIELNPWSSTIQTPDKPDWCIIDIDPDKNPFNQVVETARVTHDLLESVGVPNYCKTSGATGLHVYIPLGARYTYDQSKEFARLIAMRVQKEIPKFTTIERVVKERNGKIYIDFLQNRPQATLASPYSARPKPGATVSMPLHWGEVKNGLSQSDFTIFNTLDRLKSEGDLFKPVLGKGINLEKVLKRFQ